MAMSPDGGGAAGAAGRPAPMRHRQRFAKAENVLLAENKRHQIARYHAWSLYHHDAIYTFIPKNACTTLRFSVAVDNGFLDHGSDPAWLDNNNPTFSAAPGFSVTARYKLLCCGSRFNGSPPPSWIKYWRPTQPPGGFWRAPIRSSKSPPKPTGAWTS